jgi:hypothetical protein
VGNDGTQTIYPGFKQNLIAAWHCSATGNATVASWVPAQRMGREARGGFSGPTTKKMKPSILPSLRSVIAAAGITGCSLLSLSSPLALTGHAADDATFPEFQNTFPNLRQNLHYRGVNDYFIPLTPGYELLLAGDDDGEELTLLITVLPETRIVAGIRCAVVREMEWADGDLVEISWNYFAISRKHSSIFYFGEKVDIYEDGEVVSHDGAWLAGQNGNKAGLIMPGYPIVGSRYYQEVAPGVALDRAEHISITEPVITPARKFINCLFVEESTPLEPGHFSLKYYAPGIGLVKDGPAELVDYGFDVELPDDLEGAPDDDDDDDGDDD